MDDLMKNAIAASDLLLDMEMEAFLHFGTRQVALKDVLAFSGGDVVTLDRHIDDPVDLVLGDRIVARGEVVIANGNFAFRVTEVASAQPRLETVRCLL